MPSRTGRGKRRPWKVTPGYSSGRPHRHPGAGRPPTHHRGARTRDYERAQGTRQRALHRSHAAANPGGDRAAPHATAVDTAATRARGRCAKEEGTAGSSPTERRRGLEFGIRNSEFGMPPDLSLDFDFFSSLAPPNSSSSRRPPSAPRRRVHRRCLASRHDVVLNVMSACLASSRSSAYPEHRPGDAHEEGRSPRWRAAWERDRTQERLE